MSTARTVLGFDFGKRRIGVALGSTLTATARPLATLTNGDLGPDWAALDRLLAEWQPAALVVGLPLHLDGTAHDMTQAAQRFAALLERRANLPVHLCDERLSSVEAERRLTGAHAARRHTRAAKEAVDRLAAQVILEAWLHEQQLRPRADDTQRNAQT